MMKLKLRNIIFLIALFVSPNLAHSGPIDDLNIINSLSVALEANDVGQAKQLTQEIDDVNLQSIWAVNVLLKSLEMGDLDTSLEITNLISDHNLKDIWLANIVLKSLETDSCEVASRAVEQIIESNLSTIYKMNVAQQCSSAASLVNSLNSLADKVVEDAIAIVTTANDKSKPSDSVIIAGEGLEWICASKDNDGLAPYAFVIENKNTFEVQVSEAVFRTTEECMAALSQPIEILDGGKFFCSSKDGDGLNPSSAFRWNVENNRLINFDKLLLINGSTQECMDSLVNVSVRDGIAYVCASKDKDGLAPYSMFPVSVNPDPVGRTHRSLEDCIRENSSNILANKVVEDATAIVTTANDKSKPSDSTTLAGEEVKWRLPEVSVSEKECRNALSEGKVLTDFLRKEERAFAENIILIFYMETIYQFQFEPKNSLGKVATLECKKLVYELKD